MSGDRISVWSGLMGITVTPAFFSEGRQSSQKVRGGKLVPSPPPCHEGGRKELYLLFIGQLDTALRERARTAEWLHEKMAISKSLQALVCQFHGDVIHAIQKTLGRRRAGAPTTLADAKKLAGKVIEFEARLDRELTHDHVLAFDLAVCMRDLCDDVHHYIRQIELTAAAVFAQAGKPLIGNRPTNWAAKNELAALISDFKKARGDDAWPSGAAMRAALKRRGHECSERSVRGWVRQFKSDSAWLYVQQKKRRQ